MKSRLDQMKTLRRGTRTAAVIAVCMELFTACGTTPSSDSRNSSPSQSPSTAGAGAPGTPQSVGVGPLSTDNPANLMPMLAPAAPANPDNCNQDVDIVFSLDVSGSMGPPLTKLDNEVVLVDMALQTKDLPSPPHYGLVIFVDDYQVMNNGMAYPTLDALRAELTNQITITNGNSARQVADNGPPNLSWPENSLDSLYAAATQFHWRPASSTLRTIIHITDDAFWDLDVASSGDPTEAPGLTDTGSMHSYADTVAALRAQTIWVNTFTAKTGGPPDGMPAPASHGTFRGISVDVGKGFSEPYDNMPSIPMATGGFSWDIDDVYDGKISLAAPINMSIEVHHCAMYPLN